MSILKISASKIKGGRGRVGWCHWLLPPPSLIKGVWSLTLLICLMNDYVQGAIREEVKSKAGSQVDLPCMINQADCGDFHSIKWYKENRRVYVYSPIANFAKAEGELVERGQLFFDGSNATTRLQIQDLKTTDEGEYKCEITFLDITKDCPVVQLVKLTTLAKPKYLNVSLADGRDITTEIIGPFNEGHELRLVCESGGGKPIPRVTWYNGSSVISGKTSSIEEEDGTGTGRNEVRIKLGRGDLGSQFTCQAENEAIEEPLSTSVQVDVNLRPYQTKVTGAEEPHEEGSVVTLFCRTWGARPAAVITWFNGSRPFSEQPAAQVAIQNDDTYETQSRISFVASRFENGESITCEANNAVLDHYQEQPQRESVNLAVLYSPVVEVSPSNITTNESVEVTIYCTFEANPTALSAVRWYRNGQILDLTNRTKYDGATLEKQSLVIRSVHREDSGRYSCVLENRIGASESKSTTLLTVLYKPTVTLRMGPSSPISELDRKNVTLICDLESGYPKTLSRVNWYMDGNLLKRLPDCPTDQNPNPNLELCDDIDPSRLLLEHVSKLFHGNYSCEAANEAGWSERSEPQELEIYYPPGTAFISKDTEQVLKGQAITLTCSVDEPGRPEATQFIWQRGEHVVNNVNSFNWTIDPVTLETEANISCVAVNQVGQGKPDFIAIQVIAPPTFILRLPPYTGAMAEVSNFSIECQVECSPLCEIVWLKDGVAINEDDERYNIIFGEKPPNPAKNDFESMYSSLNFNIHRWPGGKLDRIIDNANYTCQSKSWQVSTLKDSSVSDVVSSTTYFRVEYPPENIEISERYISVHEGDSPEKILCTAEAYPKANYHWEFQDETVVGTDNLLFFDQGIRRDQAGEYKCIAENRHGKKEITTHFDVQYRPECKLYQTEDEGQIKLTCEAKANPSSVAFSWSRGGNVSQSLSEFEVAGLISTYIIEAPSELDFGTYYCQANNTIGVGLPCELEVQGLLSLKMGSANVIIIVAVIAACIVGCCIIVVVVVLICRRRKPNEKYTNHQDMEERENSEADDDHGNSTADTTSSEKSEAIMEATAASNNSTTTTDKPVHKWPIRPGVHVHVNGLHMLNNSSTSGEISGFTYGARNNSSVASDTASEKDRGVDEVTCPDGGVNQCSDSASATTAAAVANRGTSTNDIIASSNHQKDQTHHQQAASKNAMTSEAIHNNNLTTTTSTSTASKISKPKRKLHGANPNTKNSPDSGYPGDGSSGLNGELQPHNGLDNGFYENLPFHGMNKQQPHKQRLSNQVLAVHAIPVIVQDEDDEVDDVVPHDHGPHVEHHPHEQSNFMPNPNVIISSRPSSQLSQNGSSGYGSTRSQVGPFGTSNRPSPSASSSSSTNSSDNNSGNGNSNNQTKPKKKRSVWFGGSLRGRAASNSESSEQILEAGSGNSSTTAITSEIKTRGQPQYASLRIPNRIQQATTSFEDRGLDLAEAEVDSDTEANNNNNDNKSGGQSSDLTLTVAHNGYYPLRNAGSLEAQTLTMATMDPMNVMGLPTNQHHPTHSTSNLPQTNANLHQNGINGYRCGSNTSSSSGRGSSIQHASLPRHFNSRTASETTAVSPLSEVPVAGQPPPHTLAAATTTMGGMPTIMGMPPPNSVVGPGGPPPPPGLSNPLPTVSAQIQHHYNNKYNRYSNSGYQYNSHYRGPPPPTQPRSRPVQNTTNTTNNQQGIPPSSSNTSDYARYNTNVGKQIDV